MANKNIFRRVGIWLRRGVLGRKEGIEGIESPGKLFRQAFFKKKSAVVSLILLAALFLFSFVAPLFVPLDINYTDPLQQNISPGYGLRSLPRRLKKQVKRVDGFSDFTVGLSASGEVFVWGNTKNALTKVDTSKLPQAVKREGAVAVAAGKDHAIAITKSGQLVGWGDDSCGQYGYAPRLNTIPMPKSLGKGVDTRNIRSLRCGYQATALVLNDGRAYLWGNTNAVRNLADLQDMTEVADVAFCNSFAVALKTDGGITTGRESYFHSMISSKNGRKREFNAYMVGRNASMIATDNKCLAVVTDEGELIVAGAFENGEDILPPLREGEYFTSLSGGTRHFVGITNQGRALAWGQNAYGQCDLTKKSLTGGQAFAGSLQSYLVGANGKLQDSAGLRGYLMGTDGRGRDVFARIVHGGKMTLTVGGVAVVISTLIAVVVGCIAGYFGGWVDTLLMRVTEIFSAIPFLPFAMLLSQIIKNYAVTETGRILIVMLILGALSWTGLARMIRGQILSEREKEYALAAKAMGRRETAIAFKHVLPNILSVILVSVTLDFAGCLLTESALSYLGFGVQQPRPTWGNMLSGSNSSAVIQSYWWQWLFPALFLSVAVVAVNTLGDALRDALDPKD